MGASHSNDEKNMKADTQLSACRMHGGASAHGMNQNLMRYLFVDLNPSAADEVKNDPTVIFIRYINFTLQPFIISFNFLSH